VQYAIVEGQRQEAMPGKLGICPTCSAPMVAKCGPRVMHHWAHQGRRNCDPWWENESEWHRRWKCCFPSACREVTHLAPDGEIHRSDIRTPGGIFIEVQHSSMTDRERMSREDFYTNLVWIIDGRPFKPNFDVYHILPHPNSAVAQDLVWAKAARHMHGANGGIFFRLSANQFHDPTLTKKTLRGGLVEGIERIMDSVLLAYRGHHQYDWVRPRKTWLDAKCPVYVDFGDDWLWRLEIYDESELKCVFCVSKKLFLEDAMIKASASEIASTPYTERPQ